MLVAAVAALVGTSCTHLRMGLFVLKDNPRQNDPASIPEGKIAFETHCVQCHGEKADGHGPLASTSSVPPTDFTAPAYTKSATRICAHIAYGKGNAMPAFVDRLPERTIWDIGNYLHSLQKAPSTSS
jgi:mono/diheme cytochrome c family protein